MTHTSAKKLSERQLSRSGDTAFKMLEWKKIKLTPFLIRQIIASEWFKKAKVHEGAITKLHFAIIDYYVALAKKDKKFIQKLNRQASSKLNSGEQSRRLALWALNNLAKEGFTETLRGLSVGVRDPEHMHRLTAIIGLSELAVKDKSSNFKGFEAVKHAFNDEYNPVGSKARGVLEVLASHGDKRVLELVLPFAKATEFGTSYWALNTIFHLEKKGDSRAKEFFKKNPKLKDRLNKYFETLR